MQRIQIGKRVLFKMDKVEEYLETLAGGLIMKETGLIKRMYQNTRAGNAGKRKACCQNGKYHDGYGSITYRKRERSQFPGVGRETSF